MGKNGKRRKRSGQPRRKTIGQAMSSDPDAEFAVITDYDGSRNIRIATVSIEDGIIIHTKHPAWIGKSAARSLGSKLNKDKLLGRIVIANINSTTRSEVIAFPEDSDLKGHIVKDHYLLTAHGSKQEIAETGFVFVDDDEDLDVDTI